MEKSCHDCLDKIEHLRPKLILYMKEMLQSHSFYLFSETKKFRYIEERNLLYNVLMSYLVPPCYSHFTEKEMEAQACHIHFL